MVWLRLVFGIMIMWFFVLLKYCVCLLLVVVVV